MKGIAPVVATILMLLIVIAIIGFAFTFFSNVVTTTGERVEEQAEATGEAMSKLIEIKVATGQNVIVQNKGPAQINAQEELTLLIDEVITPCVWDSTYVNASQLTTCTLAADCTGSTITVIGPTNTPEKVCE